MSQDQYEGSSGVFLVPVRVTYHDATDTVYQWIPPTDDDIRRAIRNKFQEKDLGVAKKLLSDAHRKVKDMMSEHPEFGMENIFASLHLAGRMLRMWD